MQDLNFQDFDPENQQSLDFYAVPRTDLDDDRIPSGESLPVPKYSFDLSTKKDFIDKAEDSVKKELQLNWRPSTFSLEEFRKHVKAGYPFTACLLKGAVRGDANFENAKAIFVDIDNKNKKTQEYEHQLTIEEALALPFIQDHCSMIYTSASHKRDWHRFRLVFLLPSPCSDPVAYKQTILGVCACIPGYDRGATSISNIFYGNSNARFPLFNPDARLDLEALPIVEITEETVEKIANSDKPALSNELSLEGLGREINFETLDEQDVRLLSQAQFGRKITLTDFITRVHQQLLTVEQKPGVKSDLLALFYKDVCGVVNACKKYKISFDGDPDILINEAAKVQKITPRRLALIIKKVNKETAMPFTVYAVSKSTGDMALGEKKFLYRIFLKMGLISSSKAFQRFTKEKWIGYRGFTPDVVINENFLAQRDRFAVTISINADLQKALDNYDLIFVNSGLGTGKTEAIGFWLRDKYGVLNIGYRNALLTELCRRINDFREGTTKIYHLKNDEAKDLIRDLKSLLSFCLDSLHHFWDDSFDGRIVLIDEAVSVVLHLMTSKPIANFYRKNADDDFWAKGRAKYLYLFAQAIGRADKVILLDGHLNDATCKYIEDVRAEAGKPQSSIKLLNTFQTSKINAKFITDINDEGKVQPYGNEALSRHLLTVLGCRLPGQKIAVIADNTGKLRSLETIINGLGYQTLLVCKHTKDLPLQEEFCKNPSKFLNKHPEIDAILMSPTVESGIDISNKNMFLCGFAYFSGLISTNSQMQFLRRVRHCSDWFIHCVPKCNLYDKRNLSEWNDAGVYYVDQTLEGKELESVKKQVLINMGMVQNSISWKYHSDLLDSLLFERDNSKECLIYALKSSGDNVKDDVRKLSDKALKNELKLITDERLMSEAQQTNDAEKISYEEAQSLMSNIDPTEAQQFQIDRALLVQRLGGDEDNSVITPNLIFNWLRDRKQGSIERMERYVQITRRSEAMNVNKKNLIDKISSADSTDLKLNPNLEIQLNSSRRKLAKFCSYDLPINETRITALCEIGIIALIDGNWHDSNSVMLIEIKQKICSNPVLLSLFGKGIASEDPKQWVKALNSILAENGFRVKNKRTRSDGQNQKRQYQYLPPTLTEAEKTDTRAAVEEADRLALIEAHWLQTERLEQGCNKAFDNKMEKMKDKISDYNFDKKSLILNEIPHYSEWATEAEIEAYDFMWNEAREHKRTTGEEGRCNEVMKAVRTDYEALQPTEILSLGKKSYSITKPLPRSCAEVVADIKAVSLSVPGNEDELDI